MKISSRLQCAIAVGTCLLLFSRSCNAFLVPQSSSLILSQQRKVIDPLCLSDDENNGEEEDDAAIEEDARVRIVYARRIQLRSALKSAESLRNFRIKNGFVPELDENGKPIKSDGKAAVTLTAFCVAAGAIALRIGGRAALVSAVGLDFFTDNVELQTQMNQVLELADTMDPVLKAGLFCLAWTAIKVFCFDAGGVVLALSSGILFGGVLQGAAISAFGATVGSSAAFWLAKLDTPVRKKALEVLDDNPSLRGIEKVVAEDGLKAVLTLRLAPVLPIPIGLYNYVYGVTNVPYWDFAGGIFLGSLKPYLLDSYLGYFGKTVVDGTASQDGGIQDVLLLVALGVSVLIGVFASQLAGETWEAVLEEEETAKKQKNESNEEDENDGIVRKILGWSLPDWVVGFQLSLQESSERVNAMLLQEFEAKVWNYTKENPIPRESNPAFDADSPEMTGAYKGIQLGEAVCDALVLTPVVFKYYFQFSDPLFDEEKFQKDQQELKAATVIKLESNEDQKTQGRSDSEDDTDAVKRILLERLQRLREALQQRLDEIERQA